MEGERRILRNTNINTLAAWVRIPHPPQNGDKMAKFLFAKLVIKR